MPKKTQEWQLIDLSPPERVEWLWRKIWRGSQSRMAADTGVAQSTISLIISGKRQPGQRVLTAIAAHPLVNAAWLMTGEGNPIASGQPEIRGGPAEGSTTADTVLLPLAGTLLSGSPLRCFDLITGAFRVPAALAAKSRYFYRVPRDLPATVSRALRIVAGDMLFIETAISQYANVKKLANQLCVLRLQRESPPQLVLLVTQDTADAGTDYPHVMVVRRVRSRGKLFISEPPVPAGSTRSSGRPARAIRRVHLAAARPPTGLQEKPAKTFAAVLVGVCIRLNRTWAS